MVRIVLAGGTGSESYPSLTTRVLCPRAVWFELKLELKLTIIVPSRPRTGNS